MSARKSGVARRWNKGPQPPRSHLSDRSTLPSPFSERHIPPMASPPDKTKTKKAPKAPRPSRGRSGKPTPPPAETAAGVPAPRGFAEAPQARFDAGAPSPLVGEGRGGGTPQRRRLRFPLTPPHKGEQKNNAHRSPPFVKAARCRPAQRPEKAWATPSMPFSRARTSARTARRRSSPASR